MADDNAGTGARKQLATSDGTITQKGGDAVLGRRFSAFTDATTCIVAESGRQLVVVVLAATKESQNRRMGMKTMSVAVANLESVLALPAPASGFETETKRSTAMQKAIAFLMLAMLATIVQVQAGVIFEDDFNRTTLGPNWSYGGADPTKAYIKDNYLWLDAAGPVYYANSVATGTLGSAYTVEFKLVQPSPSGDIGCFVGFGNNTSFRYIFEYGPWSPYMYLISNGTEQYKSPFADLRYIQPYICINIETNASGSSTVSFNAYTDSTKATLITTTGTVSISGTLGDGYVGFGLPNDYWSGLAIDNFKISQVPEPAMLGLLVAGALGLVSARSRRRT